MSHACGGFSRLLAVLAALAVVAFARPSLVQSGSVVCHLEHISGFEKEYDRGKHVLPAATSDSNSIAVFVTMRKGVVYFQSNRKSSLDPANVVKIATNESTDLKTLLLNVLPETEQTEATVEKLHKTTKYVLDTSVFNPDSSTSIDLEGAENVWIVTADSFEPRKALLVEKARGPPSWCYSWRQHVYIPASTSAEALKTLEALGNATLDGKSLRFASLVEDTATDKAIGDSKSLSRVLFKPPPRSKADVEKLFADAKGHTVVIMGHVEAEDFVTRDARRKEIFRVSISELQTRADAQGCKLVALGCASARVAEIGVADRFNSVDAVARLTGSIDRPTFGAFAESLSSPTLRLVLGRVAAENGSQTAEFAVEASRGPNLLEFANVGQLKLYRPKSDQEPTP